MKSQTKFTSVLLGSWIVKVLSFVTALFIVIAVRYLNVNDRIVTIALDVTLPSDPNITPVSLVPNTIDIVITGSDKIIYLVDPSQITAHADFSDVTSAGIARSTVDLQYDSDIFVEAGLTLDSKPSTVRILFEEINP